jgi:hypothetical protein
VSPSPSVELISSHYLLNLLSLAFNLTHLLRHRALERRPRSTLSAWTQRGFPSSLSTAPPSILLNVIPLKPSFTTIRNQFSR